MVSTIISLNSLKRYSFNESLNKIRELILNEEVQNSAENSFTSYGFNPTDQMLLENTSNILLCNKQFKKCEWLVFKLCIILQKETDDASLVSGFACRNSLLELRALFKPNIPLEQCDGGFFFSRWSAAQQSPMSQSNCQSVSKWQNFNFKIIRVGVWKREKLILQMEL